MKCRRLPSACVQYGWSETNEGVVVVGLFTVDESKCKRDGICAAECPASIIKIGSKDRFPAPAAGAEALCINCGHCVAVCPHGAMSLQKMKAEDCPPLQKERLPGPGQVEYFLRSRRSIRTYKDQPVERAVLTTLIDIARYAPSGNNLQPVNWLVIEDSGEVRRLAGLVIDWMRYVQKENPAQGRQFARLVDGWEKDKDLICRGAPHVVVAHAPKAEPTATAACTIALTYLELAAFSLGLGACWAGYFAVAAANYPPLAGALGLPESQRARGAMLIGHPVYQYHRLPQRNNPAITWR